MSSNIINYFKRDNIELLAFDESHIETSKDWINIEEINFYLGSRFPVGIEEQKKWYKNLIETDNKKKFIISVERDNVGMASFSNIDHKNQNLEIGIYIVPKSRKAGYAKTVIKMMLNFSFNELNMHKIYALIHGYNISSTKLFESVGFSCESVDKESLYCHGEFINVVKYSIFRRDFKNG